MRAQIIIASLATLALGFSMQALAQSQPESSKTFTHGESKRCESLSGAAKDQCDKEEATKTQEPAAQESAKTPQPATREEKPSPASGGSAAPADAKSDSGRTEADKGVPMPTD